MDLDGITYVCGAIATLAIVPVRIYVADTMVWHFSPVSLPVDPLAPHENAVLSLPENVGYYFADSFLYYGVVRSGEVKAVFGPLREPGAQTIDWREVSALANVAAEDADAFANGMAALGIMELYTALQALCMVNYVMNGEQLRLDDLVIEDQAQVEFERELAEQAFREGAYRGPATAGHSTAQLERIMCDFVRQGRVEELRGFFASLPPYRAGALSPNRLRHEKNTFITSATLVSRAAIEGGMDAEDALTLSDTYINKCELLTSVEQVSNLMYRMILDYAQSVERLRVGSDATGLVLGVTNYVRKHLYGPIRTQDIADALYVSRGFLSTRFKLETGIALADYVQQQKVGEAKRLLSSTSQSLLSISTYLGYCSQSHFTAVFKRHTGMTPNQYRLKTPHWSE